MLADRLNQPLDVVFNMPMWQLRGWVRYLDGNEKQNTNTP